MAAHQILCSFFGCFIPICEALNLTAQSFVQRIFERKPSPTRTDELKRTIINFIKAGGIAGGVLVAVMACIPLFSPFFSLDPAVITKVNSATPKFAFLFSSLGNVNSEEGLLLGQKDLGILRKAHAIWFFAVATVFAASGIAVGVKDMLAIFSLHQIVRVTAWMCRLRCL